MHPQSTIWLCVNCCTNKALTSIIENIQTKLDDNKYVANLKKAFDTIDHGTPIEKLDQFSVKDIETDSYHMWY